ncbi:EAL domain-containing protein [Streptomyces sp. NP160]|uniref:putative bifunctional diguanylate cyclase/phosphodiesterase n=1 Tax=Streptomyces sp. NP160 TaxID=2586637 RepID=UPI00111B3C75|nr:bifunctional diguanylate cyclase/phosphodiesterase [Streptomyces sp. NP160]TNM58378.1 EAL domain-containing protein [Streptomyces sp. NP160]
MSAEVVPLSLVATAGRATPAQERLVMRTLLDAGLAASDPLLVVEVPSAPRRGRRASAVPLEQARVLWANRSCHDLLRAGAGELVGRPVVRLLAPLGPDQLQPQVLRRGRPGRSHVEVLTADGTLVPVLMQALPASTGRTWALSLAPVGTPAERAAQQRAGAQERRFAALVEHSPVPTIISEAGLRLAHVNDAFCDLLGEAQSDLLGTAWVDRVADDDLPAVLECVERALGGAPSAGEVRLRRSDGQQRWVHLRLSPTASPGHGAGFVGTAEDFTDRRAFEERLAHQARHDALTGLPNRTALVEAMTARLAPAAGGSAAAAGSSMTCVFLDLDNFKVINDSLGHDAGDRLLVAVAERLRSVVRAGDVVSRWGGDEFVVVCDGVPDEPTALAVGEQLLDRLREGVELDGVRLDVAASVGVTRATDRHRTPDDVLADCDIAMYRAKRAGRDRVALCDEAARTHAHERLVLTLELREALAAGHLTVEYQPVLDVADAADGPERCALPAVEALVRWRHPQRGLVPPDLLVETAEANGLIDAVGLFVLREACGQALRWDAELGDLAPRAVNVNLSAIQLCSPHLVDDVAAVLAQTGLPPERLCLEVTETALMQDGDAASARLLRLRAMGVRIALDDFGTGYSSLARLRTLPLDSLKVDRSFVLELSQGHPQVASAVIGLARSLGLVAVAEGVESSEQAAALRALGAQQVQGWLYARAMAAQELVAWRRGEQHPPGQPPQPPQAPEEHAGS